MHREIPHIRVITGWRSGNSTPQCNITPQNLNESFRVLVASCGTVAAAAKQTRPSSFVVFLYCERRKSTDTNQLSDIAFEEQLVCIFMQRSHLSRHKTFLPAQKVQK